MGGGNSLELESHLVVTEQYRAGEYRSVGFCEWNGGWKFFISGSILAHLCSAGFGLVVTAFSVCGRSVTSVQIVRLVSSAVTLARETEFGLVSKERLAIWGQQGVSLSPSVSLSFSLSLHATAQINAR